MQRAGDDRGFALLIAFVVGCHWCTLHANIVCVVCLVIDQHHGQKTLDYIDFCEILCAQNAQHLCKGVDCSIISHVVYVL